LWRRKDAGDQFSEFDFTFGWRAERCTDLQRVIERHENLGRSMPED
jgi:hypothetical protein